MDNQKTAMFSAALIGGAVAGVLSGIPFVNCLCCLWVIGGGVLAAYLLSKNSPVALSAGDGAIVGVFAGIVAAVVHSFVNILFRPFNEELLNKFAEWLIEAGGEMPTGFEGFLEGGASQSSISGFFIGLLVSAMIFSALGVLGGIIGISLFGKKSLPPKNEGVVDVPKDTGDSQS
jgi:hypothetical protein